MILTPSVPAVSSGSLPRAKTHRVVRLSNDGRSIISENCHTQREIHTIRLLEADVLAKEHAPCKPMCNVSGAGNNFRPAETRTP